MTTPEPTIDTGDIDAKLAEIDARLADHDTRIAALEAGGAPPPNPGGERVVGVTEPTAANTGGGANRARATVHEGDLICQDGQTYEDIDVRGGHVILAPNCVVRRVTATGRQSGGTYYSAIFWGDNAADALVEDCVARPTPDTYRVSLNGFGWSGEGYTARWNDISGVTDYFHGTGNDMTMEANYGHHYSFNSSDPDQGGGWNHADAVQVLGGDRPRIIGNSFWMNYDDELSVGVDELLANGHYSTAWGGGYGNIVTFSFKASSIREWEVLDNWMRGGEVAVQMPKINKGHDTGNDGLIGGNRVYVDTANRWHSGGSKHHFRQDADTGAVSNARPDVDAGTGQQLAGTYSPLSIKTPV